MLRHKSKDFIRNLYYMGGNFKFSIEINFKLMYNIIEKLKYQEIKNE